MWLQSLLHGFSTPTVEISDYLPYTIVRNPKSGEEKAFDGNILLSYCITGCILCPTD